MAFVNSGQSGAVQSASTQLSQRFSIVIGGGNTTASSRTFLSRGAPRILVSLFQSTATDPASVVLQASVSDVQTITPESRPEWLNVAGPVLTPAGTWQTIFSVVPGKLLRLSVTSPAAGGVTLQCAIMASQ
jgi:hypothetical protein